MYWTVIMTDSKGVGEVRVFYGPQEPKNAMKVAEETFKTFKVSAIVAGHHITSVYIRS